MIGVGVGKVDDRCVPIFFVLNRVVVMRSVVEEGSEERWEAEVDFGRIGRGR